MGCELKFRFRVVKISGILEGRSQDHILKQVDGSDTGQAFPLAGRQAAPEGIEFGIALDRIGIIERFQETDMDITTLIQGYIADFNDLRTIGFGYPQADGNCIDQFTGGIIADQDRGVVNTNRQTVQVQTDNYGAGFTRIYRVIIMIEPEPVRCAHKW